MKSRQTDSFIRLNHKLLKIQHKQFYERKYFWDLSINFLYQEYDEVGKSFKYYYSAMTVEEMGNFYFFNDYFDRCAIRMVNVNVTF